LEERRGRQEEGREGRRKKKVNRERKGKLREG
jgi:hypothetical protein